MSPLPPVLYGSWGTTVIVVYIGHFVLGTFWSSSETEEREAVAFSADKQLEQLGEGRSNWFGC